MLAEGYHPTIIKLQYLAFISIRPFLPFYTVKSLVIEPAKPQSFRPSAYSSPPSKRQPGGGNGYKGRHQTCYLPSALRITDYQLLACSHNHLPPSRSSCHHNGCDPLAWTELANPFNLLPSLPPRRHRYKDEESGRLVRTTGRLRTRLVVRYSSP